MRSISWRRRARTEAPEAGSHTNVVSAIALSVVIPFRDVAPYFDECLESVFAGLPLDCEVVLVDDGSVDGSRQLAERFVSRAANVTILDSRGRGPGVARNVGVRAARGDYLAFVDADDRLPKGALKTLLKTAQLGAADVVVGGVARFDTSRLWHPRWIERVHGAPHLDTTAASFPEVLRNNYAWNKVYRRDFWDAQDLWFESDGIYEDQPLVARLLWRAARVDVLDTVVYHYRMREDRSSISQRPEEIGDLIDRIAAWERTSAALAEDGAPDSVVDGWLQTLFETHFHWYLGSASLANDEYWLLLRSALDNLFDTYPSAQALIVKLPIALRVPLLLLAAGLQQVAIDLQSGDLALERVRERISQEDVGAIRAWDTIVARFGDRVFESLLVDLRPDPVIVRAEWKSENGRLCLAIDLGTRVESAAAKMGLRLLVSESSGVSQFLEGELVPSPLALRSLYGVRTLTRFEVDLSSLLGPISSQSEASIWAEFTAGNETTVVPVSATLGAGGAAELSSTACGGNRRLEARLVSGPHSRSPRRIRISAPKIRLGQVALCGRRVTGTFASNRVEKYLEFTSTGGTAASSNLVDDGDGNYRFDIDLPESASDSTTVSWDVATVDTEGRRAGVRWPEGRIAEIVDASTTGAVRVLSSANGFFKVEEYVGGVLVANTTDPTGRPLGHALRAAGSEEHDRIENLTVVASQSLLSKLPIVLTNGGVVERVKPRGIATRHKQRDQPSLVVRRAVGDIEN